MAVMALELPTSLASCENIAKSLHWSPELAQWAVQLSPGPASHQPVLGGEGGEGNSGGDGGAAGGGLGGAQHTHVKDQLQLRAVVDGT